MLTLELMERMWPHGDQHVPGLRTGIAETSAEVFKRHGITTSLVVAHAMAQFSEECGQGLEMEENLSYTRTRILQIFPTHFTPSMATRAAHNPKLLGDVAYGGRMGNAPPPSNDGYDFRGRGLSQVTGREGYQKLEDALKREGFDWNIMEDPDLVCDPEKTLECGVLDFILCGCLPYAEKDDVLGVTKRLNGGTNGLQERRRQLKLWKTALGV